MAVTPSLQVFYCLRKSTLNFPRRHNLLFTPHVTAPEDGPARRHPSPKACLAEVVSNPLHPNPDGQCNCNCLWTSFIRGTWACEERVIGTNHFLCRAWHAGLAVESGKDYSTVKREVVCVARLMLMMMMMRWRVASLLLYASKTTAAWRRRSPSPISVGVLALTLPLVPSRARAPSLLLYRFFPRCLDTSHSFHRILSIPADARHRRTLLDTESRASSTNSCYGS